MSILQIIQYPDLRLRRKGYKVTDATLPKIKKIIDDMCETLDNTENCAALAATQLDIEQPPSIAVINTKIVDSDIFCLINPRIIARKDYSIMAEGCMSIFPGQLSAKINRATKIQLTTLDLNGKKITFEAEGHLAHYIQHECDHLNGIIYIDHFSPEERALFDQEVQLLQNQQHD